MRRPATETTTSDKSPQKARRAAAIGVAALLLAPATLIRPDLAPEALEATYAASPSAFIEVDGLRMHFRDTGDGPALLLLHGSNASLHTWEGWRSALDADHRVVAVDLPGHGLTGPDPQKRYDSDAMAEIVVAFADAIGLDSFAVGGSSMGGGVAWRIAAAAPDRVDHLVLVGSTGYPQDGGPPPLYRIAAVPGLGALLTKMTPRVLVASMLRSAYGDPDRLDDETIDRYWAMLRREGNRAAARERFAGPSYAGTREEIRTVRVPTLVLWGAADTWVSPRDAEQFGEDISGAEVVVYDDVGHLPMEEAPDRSAADVATFLAARR